MKFKSIVWKTSLAVFAILYGGTVRASSSGYGDGESLPDADSTQQKAMVPLLYGTQDASLASLSYSSVLGSRLLHQPVSSYEQSLYGLLPGLFIDKNNGGFGLNNTNLLLRGTAPLVVVDGIPRAAFNINMEQIESVTLLKDAVATSMMGMTSGGGVLYIKTRRGEVGKTKVSFTAQQAQRKQMFRPHLMQADGYAALFNEALVNDGHAPAYSLADLADYASGQKPYSHPDVLWYDELLQDRASMQQYNLSFSGGGKVSRFFIDLNVSNQKGFIKEDNGINTYHTGDAFKEYHFRSNLDIELTPTTLLQTGIAGRMSQENSPGAITSNFYRDLYQTPNNAYVKLNPDNTLGGNKIYLNNLYGQAIHSGYRNYNEADLMVDLGLTQKLTGLIEGAYVKGLVSFNTNYGEMIDRSKGLKIFEFLPLDGAYNQLTNPGQQNNASSYTRQSRMMVGEVSFGYDVDRGEHSLKNQLVYSHNSFLVSNYLPFKNYGAALQSQYSFKKRYMAELAMSYQGMNRFKSGQQWGFFPSVGLGWNMAQETWFESMLPLVNSFKLKTSLGKAGDNGAASYYRQGSGSGPYYYNYLIQYEGGDNAYFGTKATANGSIVDGTLAYSNTWAEVLKYNAGVELAAWNNSLTLNLEYFNNYYSQLPQVRGTNNSGVIGVGLPAENMRKQRFSGFEMDGSYQVKLTNGIQLLAGANVTVLRSKLVFADEPVYPLSHMQRTGRPIGVIMGYVADGFYQSETDIANSSVVNGYLPQPGDLKYRDLNNDKIIDERDRTAIGGTKPLVYYGLNGGVRWKGVEFSMLWQGVANRDLVVNDMPFQPNSSGGYGQALASHANRWSKENPDARYPRLSASYNAHNQQNSSFWIEKGDYLRLKHVELAYSLPQKWVSGARISNLKLFVNLHNAMTISGLDNRDPEVVGYSDIPNEKAWNIGVSCLF